MITIKLLLRSLPRSLSFLYLILVFSIFLIFSISSIYCDFIHHKNMENHETDEKEFKQVNRPQRKKAFAILKQAFSQLNSHVIDIVQEDQDEQIAYGMLFIKKPYYIRCHYFKPYPLIIIANKKYISIYDREYESLTRIGKEENIFDFLLNDKIDLEKNFLFLKMKKIINKSGNEQYEISILDLTTDKIFTIKLEENTKSNKIYIIKEIEIDEGDDLDTHKDERKAEDKKAREKISKKINIKFLKIYKVNKMHKKLFYIQDPDIFGPVKEYNREELLKFVE